VSDFQTDERIEMKLKVHHPNGDVIAEVYDYAAGALLMSLYGNGSYITYKGASVWEEGTDGEGAESYDTVGMVIDSRLISMGVQVDG
jgi:hypothetical protein